MPLTVDRYAQQITQRRGDGLKDSRVILDGSLAMRRVTCQASARLDVVRWIEWGGAAGGVLIFPFRHVAVDAARTSAVAAACHNRDLRGVEASGRQLDGRSASADAPGQRGSEPCAKTMSAAAEQWQSRHQSRNLSWPEERSVQLAFGRISKRHNI